jgi:hypothetical protein
VLDQSAKFSFQLGRRRRIQAVDRDAHDERTTDSSASDLHSFASNVPGAIAVSPQR